MPERMISSPAEFAELQKECIARIRFYVDLANKKMNLGLPYPTILFALKGTTAGTANYATNTIKINPTLLRENPDDFLEQTTGHEVGHLAARFRHRGKDIDPHGAEWRNVMWTLGLPATRCHNYDVSNVPTRATSVPRGRVVPVQGVRQFGNGKVIEFD